MVWRQAPPATFHINQLYDFTTNYYTTISMKKFYPIFLIVALATITVGLTYWRGQSQPVVTLPILPPEPPVADAQNQATQPPPTLDTAPVSTADWKTYRNTELGVEFSYPAEYEVNESREITGIDTGKRFNVSLVSKNNAKEYVPMPFNIVVTSRDYKEGAGEGCCSNYSSDPLDLQLSLEAISDKIKKLEPFSLRRVQLGNVDALRFYSIRNYIDFWVNDSLLSPYKRGNFDNLVISGSILANMYNETQKFTDQEFKDLKDKLKQKINSGEYLSDPKVVEADRIFNQILSTFKFIK